MKRNLIILSIVLLLTLVLMVAPVAAATATVSGTVLTDPATQSRINHGGETINITLSSDVNWIPANSTGYFTIGNAAPIIDGLTVVPVGAQDSNWTKVTDALKIQNDTVNNTAIVRISDTVLNINLPPVTGYSITSNQTIKVIVQGASVNNGIPIEASPLVVIAGPPTFGIISPDHGPIGGGTHVTITGTNFNHDGGSIVVSIGGTIADSVMVNSTTITAVTPVHTAGAQDIIIRNGDGGAVTALAAYTYIGPPGFDTILPVSGSTLGGTPVTITGTNFIDGSLFNVTIGGVKAANIVRVSTTSITATTPPGIAGSQVVNITNGDGQFNISGRFTYVTPPGFDTILPVSGSTLGGTPVTITGTNFIAGSLLNVTIGGVGATNIHRVSDTSITANTPAGIAGSQVVNITNGDGQFNISGRFTYVTPPAFGTISPTYGPIAGGTTITITGSGFIDGTSFDVSIGGNHTAKISVNSTTIIATTPAGIAGSQVVNITNGDGQFNNSGRFTYMGPMSVSGISPAYGPITGGTAVTITGSGFVPGPSLHVTIGRATATNPVRNDATNITAVTSSGTAGAQDVAVTNGDGLTTISKPGAYTYEGPPVFTNITPASGTIAGGTAVIIIGTNFVNGTLASVTIGGTVTPAVWVNSTYITATTLGGPAGAADVVITNNHTQNATGIGAYSYIYTAAPEIVSITPPVTHDNGSNTTGVQILGNGFLPGAMVSLKKTGQADIPAPTSSVVVNNPNSITCNLTTKGAPAGIWNVVVTNNDTQSSNSDKTFTITVAPVLPGDKAGFFRNGVFFLASNNTAGGGIVNSFAYGITDDLPVTGQWIGSTNDTIGVYRNGVFYLRNSNTAGAGDNSFYYGISGDVPVAGHWNGIGTDTVGVFRNDTFYLKNSNTAGVADKSFAYGQAGDVPVVGDWTGSGTTTVGVFRNGTFFLRNSNTAGVGELSFAYGQAGDVPVVGDWTGIGKTTVGVFRNGTFFLKNSNTAGAADIQFTFGQTGDKPVAGYWT